MSESIPQTIGVETLSRREYAEKVYLAYSMYFILDRLLRILETD